MENLTVKDPPEFTEQIHKTKKEDYITAELENEIKSALLNNDVFLKNLAEAIREKSNTHIENGSIHVTLQDKQNWSEKAGTAVATQAADGLESAADKKKLDGIAEGAEVNQNAFSNVKAGNVTISANGKTATFVLAAGSNIAIHADNATKQITITAERDGGNADKLDGYHAEHFAVADHGHDGRYYTKTESNNLLNQKANSSHSHNNYLPISGGTLTGDLNIQPFSGEGGQLELRAAADSPTIAGIVVDNYYGTFRIFGIASADGKTKVGIGNTFSIDPYGNKVYAGTYNFEAHSMAMKNLSDIDPAFTTGTTSNGYCTTITPAEFSCHHIRLMHNKGQNIYPDIYLGGPDKKALCISSVQSILIGENAGNTKNAKTARGAVAIGYGALDSLEIGAMDVAIGYCAGYGFMKDSSDNTNPDNDETFNVFIGSYSGSSIDFLYRSILIGSDVGEDSVDRLERCTLIGSSARAKNASMTSIQDSTAIGYSATVTGNKQVQLGGSGTSVYAYSALNNRSDQRDKTDIRDTQLGLEFLLKHRAVEFRWDLREAYQDRIEKEVKKIRIITDENGGKKEEEYIEKEVEFVSVPKDGSRAGKRFHEGFIAQEVEAIMEEMGVDFAGLQNHNISGGADRYTIGYTEYIPIIIKAIQEIKQIYDTEIKNLKEEIFALKKRV